MTVEARIPPPDAPRPRFEPALELPGYRYVPGCAHFRDPEGHDLSVPLPGRPGHPVRRGTNRHHRYALDLFETVLLGESAGREAVWLLLPAVPEREASG